MSIIVNQSKKRANDDCKVRSFVRIFTVHENFSHFFTLSFYLRTQLWNPYLFSIDCSFEVFFLSFIVMWFYCVPNKKPFMYNKIYAVIWAVANNEKKKSHIFYWNRYYIRYDSPILSFSLALFLRLSVNQYVENCRLKKIYMWLRERATGQKGTQKADMDQFFFRFTFFYGSLLLWANSCIEFHLGEKTCTHAEIKLTKGYMNFQYKLRFFVLFCELKNIKKKKE